jgi:hypothetical protein
LLFAAHYQTETTVSSNQQLQPSPSVDDSSSAGPSQPGTPAAEESKENPLVPSAPSNLLVTFLEYCSIVMQVMA